MAKIEFGEIPQEFRHVEYLSDIILKIQEYTSDFEPYLDELKIPFMLSRVLSLVLSCIII